MTHFATIDQLNVSNIDFVGSLLKVTMSSKLGRADFVKFIGRKYILVLVLLFGLSSLFGRVFLYEIAPPWTCFSFRFAII